MRPQCIPKSTKGQWELKALELERTANYQQCLGAVDGKHSGNQTGPQRLDVL
jgi:hypothetical protein